jgi:hypothetical protein
VDIGGPGLDRRHESPVDARVVRVGQPRRGGLLSRRSGRSSPNPACRLPPRPPLTGVSPGGGYVTTPMEPGAPDEIPRCEDPSRRRRGWSPARRGRSTCAARRSRRRVKPNSG